MPVSSSQENRGKDGPLTAMTQHLSAVTVVVSDYDEAIVFYVEKLGFRLVEDTPLSSVKRWVPSRRSGSTETCLLLAKATSDEQIRVIGNQTGGRVFLFLDTDDFDRDHAGVHQGWRGIHRQSHAWRPTARSPSSEIPSATCGIWFSANDQRLMDLPHRERSLLRTRSAPFSPIMMVGALVLALVTTA